jgi:hypothetical protein
MLINARCSRRLRSRSLLPESCTTSRQPCTPRFSNLCLTALLFNVHPSRCTERSMPYERPNPLTVAHSVMFLQTCLLRHLPENFVQQIGLDEARVALSLCLRPAGGSLEIASARAMDAMAHVFTAQLDPSEFSRELCLHSMLVGKCLPDPARRDVLRAVLAIAVKAGALIHGDLEKFVRVDLPGLLGVKFGDLSTHEDENALSADFLNYPPAMVQLAIASLQQVGAATSGTGKRAAGAASEKDQDGDPVGEIEGTEPAGVLGDGAETAASGCTLAQERGGDGVPPSASASSGWSRQPSIETAADIQIGVDTSGALHLRVRARCILGYAMVAAGIPVVDSIEIGNVSVDDAEDIVVEVRVSCAMQDAPLATRAIQIDTIEGRQALEIPLRELRPDPRLLVQLDEAAVGSINAVVRRGEETLATVVLPLRVLAYTQWCEVAGCYELLASHVMPNHPALVPVRQQASELLKAATGQSSQEGYQEGEQRALQIAEASYQALLRSGIHYSNPPATSEARQKIRTPDQVLDERFGTCLDTTCLLAGLLEQAGLNAVMFVVQGHAFAGFFPMGDQLGAAVERDVDVVRNLVEHGRIVPIETTTLCEGQQLPFDEAVKQARRRVFETRIETLISIHDARIANIRPLPSRVVGDGRVWVVHQEATSMGGPVVQPPRRVQAAKVTTEPMPSRLRKWQSDLLDLSLRNPLLNVKIGRGGGVRLVTPPGQLHDIERILVGEGSEVELCAHDNLTELQKARGAHLAREMAKDDLQAEWSSHRRLYVEVEDKALRTRLRQLMNQARSMEEESGANILHVSLGTIVWTDPDKGKRVRSPLLTIPVRLDLKARGKPPRLIADLAGGGTAVNQCLLTKLKQSFRFDAPAAVAGWRGDRDEADIRTVFEAMQTAIARDLPGATLEQDAALCLLHFGKFRMWKDLEEFWPEFLKQPVVRHFVERPGQQYPDLVAMPSAEELESSTAYCPIPIDGSQLEAVVAAVRGCSFVLEGPPGTGKSQTITNLIANALAGGKKVLFVAEKRAALEVVKHRLDRVGLGTYCLDIHGKASKPKDLCAQLIKSHDAAFSADLAAFDKLRQKLGVEAEALRGYARRLHETNGIGHSLWSAHQATLSLGDGFAVPVPASVFAGGQVALTALRDGLRDLKDIAGNAGLRPRHEWGMVASTDGESLAMPSLAAAIEAMDAAFAATLPGADAETASALAALKAPAGLRGLVALLAARAAGYAPTLESLRLARTVAPMVWQRHASAAAAVEQRLTAARRLLQDAAFHVDLRNLAAGIEQAKKSFFLWRGGRVRAAVAAAQPLLRAEAPAPDALVAELRGAADAVTAAKELAESLRSQHGLSLPADWSPLQPGATDVLAAALAASREAGLLAATADEPALAAVLAVRAGDVPSLRALLTARAAAVDQFLATLRVDEVALLTWLDGRSLASAVAETLPRWRSDAKARFLGLVRWCKLQAKLAPLDGAGFGGIREAVLSGAIRADQVVDALDRSIARACVDERQSVLGFQRFDGKEHGTRVQRHGSLHADESKALADVLPARLLGTRPFASGERKGVVGELRRKELERARPRSIRAMLDDYADAVLALTPCVLASPDSVAQFLVPGSIEFDLVVFDEASQVPVADAIGVIGRGKAVVIVGDSKQMPPTAFFARSSASAAEDESPSEEDTPDMDSILTEARNDGIRPILLSWHYRSQDETLIAFSNRHYYDSRLSSFPTPTQRLEGRGLSWIKVVDGVFDSAGGRVNPREADELVAEVRRRLADPVEAKRSLGIVTMNLTQAELVREKLEAVAEHDPALRRALDDESEDRLFVKNLENVQGDERDVILIGTTYGKGPDGRMRMQFGPLGKAGGEKRWNVLVTRARQQVVVVSSMEPEDIRTQDVSASATGVHHMRAYLEMCKRGVGNSLESRLRPVETKDLHREDIATALRQRGLHVETNIGLSTFKVDIAVADSSDPGRRLVAILLDGPGYAARRTVQDRELLPVNVLQSMMGWPKVARIWLPEWLLERERVVDDIVAACDEAKAVDPQATVVRAGNGGRPVTAPEAAAAPEGERTLATQGPVVDPLQEQLAARRTKPQVASSGQGVAPSEASSLVAPIVAATAARESVRDAVDRDFVPYEDGSVVGTKDDVTAGSSAASHQRIRAVIEEVLRVEAPIEEKRLARLVARRFGLQRVHEDRVRVVLDLVDQALIRRSAFGTFVWSRNHSHPAWREFRRTSEEHARSRTFDLVSPEEARNALVHCATKGMGVSDEGAIEELKSVFSVGKSSQDFRERAQALIAWCVDSGALVRDAKGRLQQPKVL